MLKNEEALQMSFSSLKLRKKFKLMIIFSFIFVIAIGYLCEYISNFFMIALFIYFIVVSTYFVANNSIRSR